MPLRRICRLMPARRATSSPIGRSTSFPRRVASANVKDGLAGEFAVDEAPADRADLVPGRLDGDLRSQFLRLDQLGEEPQADAGALDAHQLVEQREAIKLHTAGAEKVAALEGRGRPFGDAERYAGAVRLQHAERRAEG